MLYTDGFVFVHMPKTGGTFVTHSVFEIYGADYPRFLHWNSRYRWRARFQGGVLAHSPKYGGLLHGKRKHSSRKESDHDQRHKPVLGIVRNPFDMFVSQYEFRWWTRPEAEAFFRSRINLDREFPRFPNLSFSEYLELRSKTHLRQRQGILERDLLRYYSREPERAYQLAAEGKMDAAALKRELDGVHLLRNENLASELRQYLLANGYQAEDVDFLMQKERVIPEGPGKRKTRDWRSYYTPELFDLVRRQERLFLELFPEYDTSLEPG